MSVDIKHRCYYFSVDVVKFLKNGNWLGFEMITVKQVMRSATSIGANVVEAKNSSTKTEFKRYYEIALKSANETKYWFCILRDGFEIKNERLEELLKECNEISKVLAASILTLKRNNVVKTKK